MLKGLINQLYIIRLHMKKKANYDKSLSTLASY